MATAHATAASSGELEILVGQDLKDEYGLGHRERLRLETRGNPNWKEYEKQGRLELFWDENADIQGLSASHYR
jgi:hypothetical protein